MKNSNLDNIEKELEVLKKSINEMMEKASFSNRIKAGLLGAATLAVPSISTGTTADKSPAIQAPSKNSEVSKKQSYFFPPDSEYALHEQKNPPKILSPEEKKNVVQSPLRRGEILKDYRDPRHIPVEEKYEKMYNLPHRSITAIRVAGELSNWDHVSKAGARTTYQFMPKTREDFLKTYGVDAYKDTDSAAHATALHLRDNLRRVNVWKNRNDKKIEGIPVDTKDDIWRLATRLFNGSTSAIKNETNPENKDYGHRMEYGLKILQNNADIPHLDHIIQKKREYNSQQKQQLTIPKLKILNPTKKSLLKTRGNLLFPNILPKNSRPEQNVKQLFDPKYQTKYFSAKDLESNDGLYLIDHDKSFSFNPEKNEAISAHEAMHQTISNIAKKINNKDVSVYTKLNSLIPINQKDQIRSFLKYADRYDSKTVHQEILPWLHTILHDKQSRNAFLNHHYPINDKNKNIGWDKLSSDELNSLDHPNVKNGRIAIQKLGRSWNNIRYFAKKAAINDLKSNYSLDQRTP